MTSGLRLAVNPMPWFSYGPGIGPSLTAETLAAAIDGIADAGFTVIQADIPTGMSTVAYASLLSARNVRPAPSYWGIKFDCRDDAIAGLHEAAKRRAAVQSELGVRGMVISDEVNPARMERPGVGADFDQDRLDRVVERVADVAGV